VDGSGNLYVADNNNSAVKEIPAGCTSSSCVVTLGDGFTYPHDVAVDGAGNVYVADQASSVVKEIPAGCTTTAYSSGSCTVTTLGGGFSGPSGVAVDASGNIYVADTFNNAVKEINRTTPPSLSFASTAVGATSTDSPQTVTLANIGNADLTFASITSSTASFSLDSTTCSTTTALAAGTTCTASVSFAPTTVGNPLTGSVVFTDNSLNASGATQAVPLSGTATAATPGVSVSNATATYGAATTTLTATIAYGGVPPTGAVTLTVDGDAANAATASCAPAAPPSSGLTCTVAYPTATLSAGSHTITATIAADDNYTAASSNDTHSNGTLTIGKATQTITGFTVIPASPTYTAGGTFTVSATPGASGNPVLFTIAASSASVCSINPSTGAPSPATVTRLSSGDCTLIASEDGDANYSASTVSNDVLIGKETTVMTLSASPNPALVGQPVTLVASVLGDPPSGTVTFYDGTATLGALTLTPAADGLSSTATFTISTLAPGTHSLSATYAADSSSDYLDSESDLTVLSVGQGQAAAPVPALTPEMLALLTLLLGGLAYRTRREVRDH
jgi:hypothetical protein